jgi:hypothetical protein
VQVREAEQERLEISASQDSKESEWDRLLAEASTLLKANDIRAYVEAVQNANLNSSEALPSDMMNTWADWAIGRLILLIQ